MEDSEFEAILHDYIKGDYVKWDGAFCTYKGYDIISLFGGERITAVWVRQAMPDNREFWLDAHDPDFFKKLDAAFKVAKQLVENAEETKKLFDNFRAHLGH